MSTTIPASTRRLAYVRAYASARQRALARLARRHRGEYAALLAEERAQETDGPASGQAPNQNGHR